MKVIDITEKVFGRLKVVCPHEKTSRNGRMWICICECGSETIARGKHLRAGRIKSCGCWKTEQIVTKNRSHGLSKSRPYRIWRNMINRCHNEKYHERKYYGGRGIVVCDRWRFSFENFIADMGLPEEKMSIDRIDPDGNYEPGNCRWATSKEQTMNRRVSLQYRNKQKETEDCSQEAAA